MGYRRGAVAYFILKVSYDLQFKNKYSTPRFLLHLAQTVEQGAERQKTKLMKKILLSAIMIAFGMCTYAQNSIKIPVGKNIPVTLTSEIYSNSRASQQVSATVSNDIKADDGTVVIRRGTPVNINAEIKKAESSRDVSIEGMGKTLGRMANILLAESSQRVRQ